MSACRATAVDPMIETGRSRQEAARREERFRMVGDPGTEQDEQADAPPDVDLGDPPPDWDDPGPDRPVPFRKSVALDFTVHFSPELRGGSRIVRVWRRMVVAVRSSGFHVTFLHRVAHQCYYRLGPPGKALAGVIFWIVRHAYGCSIAGSARLHGGIVLPHPQNIVIGPGAVVGPCTYIFQNVTIGGVPGRPGMPRIGRDARIYAGAVVVGPIVLGDNVMIGANAVVVGDVPSRHLVRCPAPEVTPLPERYISRPK
jgi:serine O-acetyltransferase